MDAMIKIQIGGSPCTYWSIARAATNSPITRETVNEGLGWELYLNYLIAMEKFQPDIWLYENVASMSKEIKASISAHFDRDPYQLNGGLVSAAERETVFSGRTSKAWRSPLIVASCSRTFWRRTCRSGISTTTRWSAST